MRLGRRKKPTETNRRELNGARSHDPLSEIPSRYRTSRLALIAKRMKKNLGGDYEETRDRDGTRCWELANSALPPSKDLARVGEKRRVGRSRSSLAACWRPYPLSASVHRRSFFHSTTRVYLCGTLDLMTG